MTRISYVRVLVVVYAVLQLLLVAPAWAQTGPPPDMPRWQRAELQTMINAVSAATQGQGEFAENPFRLSADFIKGLDGTTYVPYTLSIDPSRLASRQIVMYVFIIPHADTLPDPSADGSDELPEPTFEDVDFINLDGQGDRDRGQFSDATSGVPIKLRRAFSVPGGVYDVYIAIRDSLGPGATASIRGDTPVLLFKEAIEVPDFWNDVLQTSSLILAENIEMLDQPLSVAEQRVSPYTLGTTAIVPKMNSEFSTADRLSMVFFVYNAQLASDQMPDITVGYDFHTQGPAGETFFNRTPPQQFNAQTLAPGFDLASGHQIVGGVAIPLSAFPVARYRLEITVTDNNAGQNVVIETSFSVS